MPLQVSRRVAHVEESARLNANDRQEFCNQANARMLRVIDSHANFVMVNSGRQVGRVIKHFKITTSPSSRRFLPSTNIFASRWARLQRCERGHGATYGQFCVIVEAWVRCKAVK
ncbi:MAG: hypothetical protein DMF89_25740 [Acidobacteria bacterium]|nr:MAG: hypothetical protein DMF90_10685 [Acidobacteriota bacterium]PYR45196.1 MAG: hypothetical protein DMF89_25740 [Acidobacteriota bacterium]